MYELFIGNKNYSSWSLRSWVLMRELAIPFTERLIPFTGLSNWQAFRAFAPNGKVPCLRDQATTVWDSLGIAEYLGERHDGVWPREAGARAWARCAAAEMHSGFSALRNDCGLNCGLRVQLKAVNEALQFDIARINELWCEGLIRFNGPFLAGRSFTAVDAFFAPVAFRVQTYGLTLNAPAATYVGRLLEVPSMQRWYADALAEPWRDPDHEAEVRQAGVVIKDLRVGRP